MGSEKTYQVEIFFYLNEKRHQGLDTTPRMELYRNDTISLEVTTGEHYSKEVLRVHPNAAYIYVESSK